MKFRTGYMDDPLFNLNAVITQAKRDLEDVDFDTLVGTGFSGGTVIPALAMMMGKKYVLIRKDHDDSHHGGKVMGELGHRWIFVDDFTQSGRTRDRVLRVLEQEVGKHHGYWERLMMEEVHATTYVGDYYYARDDRWRPVHVERVFEPEPEGATPSTEVDTGLPAMQSVAQTYAALTERYALGSSARLTPLFTEFRGAFTERWPALRQWEATAVAPQPSAQEAVAATYRAPLFTEDGVNVRLRDILPKEISGEL